jgi:hypothetical protein
MHTKFKCNGCGVNGDFIWLEGYKASLGYKVYQCLLCCNIGTKNIAEALDVKEPVIRCNQCGSWKFVDKPCHTCPLMVAK